MKNIDQARLDQLCFRQRCGDAQNWFVGKEDRSFGHGVDITGEAERGEALKQAPAESAALREPVDLLGGKMQPLEEVERLFEAGCDQEPASCRKFAHEEFEYRCLRLATIQVCLDHVELIKIGQQGRGHLRHSGPEHDQYLKRSLTWPTRAHGHYLSLAPRPRSLSPHSGAARLPLKRRFPGRCERPWSDR